MNKIIIDGKEYELSAELVEKIKAEVAEQEKKKREDLKEPFGRVRNERYFLINGNGRVSTMSADTNSPTDEELYAIGNYCRDKKLMEQRALHETLNRLLWRYSEMHGDQMIAKQHAICSAWDDDEFYTLFCVSGKQQGTIYFSSREVAVAAIEEVVEPFMEAHPEFVW